MRLKYTYFVFILSFTLLHANAQLIITFPMENAVFQRNQSNLATLSIAGSFPANSSLSRIDARLINASNETIVIDWIAIQNNPVGGVFSGVLSNVPGGWYHLEVRGVLNSNTVSTARLNHVGIGEVFLIAGQSNAQGLAEFGVNATDERVVAHGELSWYNDVHSRCDIRYPSYPRFRQLADRPVAKTGLSSWCYGKLGDLLTSRLGVPVVFFNASSTSTSSINWKESSDSLVTSNHYDNTQLTYCNQLGVPYANLKRIMKYYASVFGARAILWHHGETDNYINTLGNEYQTNVSYVINKSRTDFGSTIPWVISKATLFNNNDTQEDIRTAQQTLGSNSGNKIFPGPDTDVLDYTYRLDGVHFKENGVIELANLWNASLDASFFSNATPIAGKPLPVVTVVQESSAFKLTAPAGYSAYKWVRLDESNADVDDTPEATTQSITRASGNYRCYLTDNGGNITFTQTVICGCFGVDNCNGVTYISDITACSAVSGFGPVKLDKSQDGKPIKLKGVTYAKGIGSHTNSEIVYQLNGKFVRFVSDIGLDDEVSDAPLNYGSVYFKVYGDKKLLYQSPLIHVSNPTISININVEGVNELKLITDQGPDTLYYDHTDWAGARLYCSKDQAPLAPNSLFESQVGTNCTRISWTAASDLAEVEKYMIYVDNMLIDSVSAAATTYFIQNLESSHYYQIKVRAKDFSGNLSVNSNLVEVVTLSGLLLGSTHETVNSGQTVTLSSSNCSTGTITWSTGATTNSISVNPTATTIYTATCKTGECTGPPSSVTVKVLSDCASSYSLTSPTDNFFGSNINLLFKASSTINADNVITSSAKISYQAGHAIVLQPGFTVLPGTVFKAQITGCTE